MGTITFQERYSCPEFKNFQYWFIKNIDSTYAVYHNIGNDWIHEGNHNVDEIQNTWSMCESWKLFVQRPEYHVYEYRYADQDLNNVDHVSIYLRYLIGCAFIRAGRDFQHDPDIAWAKLEGILEWLTGTDFFDAPASSQYHESVPGGLCIHTLKVIDKIKDLLTCETFSNVKIEDAILVGLVHDWCKIGLYESYTRNVKDDKTGTWKQVPAFRTKSKRFSSFGHGASSMYLASRFFQLSPEEALAIRWHQGRWNVCREEFNELQQSNETYPLVHLIQFADQLSITNY